MVLCLPSYIQQSGKKSRSMFDVLAFLDSLRKPLCLPQLCFIFFVIAYLL